MKLEQLNEGVLCSLNCGRWSASVRLPKDKIQADNLPKEIVRMMQDVVDDKTLIKDIQTILRKAKRFLQANSIPFPVEGVFFVPKDKIELLDTTFKEMHAEKEARIDTLIKNYIPLKRRFQKAYPEYYDERYYPNKRELRSKFYMKWQFFQFALPDKAAGILSPKMYKREQTKFQNMVKNMEEMTVNLISEQLSQRLDSLAKQCDSGKVNAGTVNAVDRFLSRWDDLWQGHVDNKKMRMIMERLKRQMKKTNADRLKGNEHFRSETADKIGKLMEGLTNVPNFELKRKIDI